MGDIFCSRKEFIKNRIFKGGKVSGSLVEECFIEALLYYEISILAVELINFDHCIVSILTIRATMELKSEGNNTTSMVSFGINSDHICCERKFISYNVL